MALKKGTEKKNPTGPARIMWEGFIGRASTLRAAFSDVFSATDYITGYTTGYPTGKITESITGRATQIQGVVRLFDNCHFHSGANFDACRS